MAYTPYSLGQYNLTTQILTDTSFAPLQLDVNGNLKVTSTTTAATAVQGGPTGTTLYGLLIDLLTEIKRTNKILMSFTADDVDASEFDEV